jgi:hypothetical protein
LWFCSSSVGPGGEPLFPRVPAVFRDDVDRGAVLVVVVVAVVMVRGNEHLVEHLRRASMTGLALGSVRGAGDAKDDAEDEDEDDRCEVRPLTCHAPLRAGISMASAIWPLALRVILTAPSCVSGSEMHSSTGWPVSDRRKSANATPTHPRQGGTLSCQSRP